MGQRWSAGNMRSVNSFLEPILDRLFTESSVKRSYVTKTATEQNGQSQMTCGHLCLIHS